MQFIDEAKIYIKSGNGGAGCTSFRREKCIPEGGPDGGNGGRGGDIIIDCVPGLNTLIDFRYRQHFKAKSGHHGQGKNCSGAAGAATKIKVPAGTQIFADDQETLLADFTEVGQTMTLSKGGDGGAGNAQFKSSTNRAPRKSTGGWPGEEMWVWLRLKLLSDAGLVGLPNAGKSTFLARTTAAKPKIADYPFTTLKPQLGVVYVDNQEFVLADIPGLIRGAHSGIGLGDRFLKHIERCGVLLHLVDGTAEDVVESYKIIREELESYGLSDKREIVALNKCDSIPEEELQEKFKALKNVSKQDVKVISGATGEGVEKILRALKHEIDISRQKDFKISA